MVLSRDSTTTTTTTCQNNRVQRDDDSAQMPYKSPSLHCLNKGNPGYVDNFTLGRSHSHQCVNDTGLPDPKGNTDNSFCSTDSMLDISGGNYSSADNIYSSVDNFNIDKAISSAAEGYSIYDSTRTLDCSNEKLLLSDDSQYWSSDNFAISTDNIASSSDNIASSSDNIAYYTDNITNSTDNITCTIDTAISVSTDNLYISSRQNASKEAKQGKLNAEKRRHSCFSIRKEVTKRIKDNKEAESRTGEHADFYTRELIFYIDTYVCIIYNMYIILYTYNIHFIRYGCRQLHFCLFFGNCDRRLTDLQTIYGHEGLALQLHEGLYLSITITITSSKESYNYAFSQSNNYNVKI